MKYLNRSFSVPYTTDAYSDGWDRVFKPRPNTPANAPSKPQDARKCEVCGAEQDSIRNGRVVAITGARCVLCVDLEIGLTSEDTRCECGEAVCHCPDGCKREAETCDLRAALNGLEEP